MKAWGRGVCLGACAAIALLAMASAASAKPGYYVSHASRSVGLQLKGSNGYYVSVQSSASGPLVLFATNSTGSAAYLVRRQAARPDQIKASFGKLGRIALRFQPSGPPKAQSALGSECVGSAPTRQKGRFTGSLRFRGEGGFTTVHSSSVKGEIFRTFRQVCKRPPKPEGGGKLQGVSLGAYAKEDSNLPSFNAYELTANSPLGSPSVSYSASVTERRGRITIIRSASGSADPSTFVVSGPTARPITASVAPPFPFSGTGAFESGSGHPATWSGDLSVSLPGLGTVPLTGSPFTARLCRDLSCACPPESSCLIFFATSGRVGSTPRPLDNAWHPPRRPGMWGSAP